MAHQDVCFQFDTIVVSASSFEVRRDGQRLNLEPKAIRTLLFLIENRDHLVTKDDLVANVWEGTAVTDNAITRVIAQLRRELGDDPKVPKYIETVPTLGYRFIADIAPQASPTPPPPVPRRWSAPSSIPLAFLSLLAIGIWWFTRTSPDSVDAPSSSATQITTSSGTDARPSFGPDGQSFVYSSNKSGQSEIYRRASTSSPEETRLTNDGRQNIQPAWSPDGKWVAYHAVAERGIWIVPAGGGTPRRLTNFGSSPNWSPDSLQIVFASTEPRSLAPFDSGGESSIWITSLDGGQLRRLTQLSSPRGGHNFPSFSRDGKRVIFAAIGVDSAFYSLDLASSELKVLLRVGVDIPRQPGTFVSRVWDPLLGPDDRTLYFSASGERGEQSIWQAPLNGVSPRRIFTTQADVPMGLSLSPDGSRLLFTRLRGISQIWTVAPDSPPRPLLEESVVRAMVPSYSPDGKWLAFAVEMQGRNRTFWIMPATGGAPFPISNEPGQHEGGTVWSADNELFYNYIIPPEVEFRAFNPTTRKTRLIHRRTTKGLFHPSLLPNGKDLLSSCSTPFNICIGPVDAPSPRQITSDREGTTFAFSDRAGEWIAFQLKRGDFDQLAVVRRDGTDFKVLTDDPGWTWGHSFSGDGRRIAFASFRRGIWTLWWMDRNSGERRQLTRETTFGPFVRAPAFRPGSNEIAYENYQVRGNIFQLQIRTQP